MAGDDVEVADDGDAAQVEQVLAGAPVAGAAALPVADVGEGVLDLDALAELARPSGVCWRWRSSASSSPSGWTETLRPLLLAVQRCRRGHAAQVALGKRTVLPGANGMAASLFYGAPAVAFVLHTGAHPAYAAMLAALDEHINDLTALKLAAAYERMDRGELTRPQCLNTSSRSQNRSTGTAYPCPAGGAAPAPRAHPARPGPQAT